MDIEFIPTDLFLLSKEDLNTPFSYKIQLKCRNCPDLLTQPLKILDADKYYIRRPGKLLRANKNKKSRSSDSLHNTGVDEELERCRK